MNLLPGGFKEGKLNYLKVEVSDASSYALVSLNGRGVAQCQMRHARSAKGGILVVNGFKEAYSFRDFNIEVLATPAMLNTTALANIRGPVTLKTHWSTYNFQPPTTAAPPTPPPPAPPAPVDSTVCRTTSGVKCLFPFKYQVPFFPQSSVTCDWHV